MVHLLLAQVTTRLSKRNELMSGKVETWFKGYPLAHRSDVAAPNYSPPWLSSQVGATLFESLRDAGSYRKRSGGEFKKTFLTGNGNHG